jgi:glycine betaine/choline ABC-type transport system substrate-binding protein
MIFILTGCGTGQKTVVIASKPHTEQYILAEMLTQLIEAHTTIKVEKKLGIGGGTANIQPAILKGEIDIYPEYTGTGWLYVLKNDPIEDPAELYDNVSNEYKEKFNIKWLGLYGFNNTYALAVNKDLAEKYQLKTITDLAKVSQGLTFGAEYDFYEREDGLKGLEKKYGLQFKNTKEMDIGLKYDAIHSDQVDVINVFSTDGLLKKYDLKVLQDDKEFFPSYQAATLVRNETLKKYPEIEAALSKLTGQINDQEMTELNYQVEIEKQEPAVVAREFLQKKGLL